MNPVTSFLLTEICKFDLLNKTLNSITDAMELRHLH